jgi:DNA processing protein
MSALVQLTHEERINWLRLTRSENVGPVTFKSLLQRFGNPADALAALPELSRKGGRAAALRPYGRDEAEREIEAAAKIGAQFVAAGELGFPPYLRHIHAAPPLLCVLGQLETASIDAIAIVGARNASANGMKFTRMLADALARKGMLVVSGLARGIDTAAHQASIDSHTAAVMAGGIDHVYPPENEALQRAIGERGLLITEMAPGQVPKAEHFPRRNRIISGMARAVIVVEAALRSGSLITARYALEQGRDVFAVPGSPLDPRCEGSNKLIKDGAQILLSAEDVIESLTMVSRPQNEIFLEPLALDRAALDEPTEGDREHVLTYLSHSPTDVDDLIRECGLPAEHVMAILLEAELAGRVTRVSGQAIALT